MTIRQIIPALVALAMLASLLLGCGGSGDSPPASSSAPNRPASNASGSGVTIKNFKFSPGSLTVKSGATVKITNNDSTAHTATADNGDSFDTGSIDPGSSKTINVSKPGTYAYHCNIHPFMKATLVVGGSNAHSPR